MRQQPSPRKASRSSARRPVQSKDGGLPLVLQARCYALVITSRSTSGWRATIFSRVFAAPEG